MDVEDTTIKRVDTQSRIPWFQISRQLAQDPRLSFEHRGLMLYLLSKPDNWTVTVLDIQREGNMGKDKAYRLLKELQAFGYILYEHDRGPDGSFVGGHYCVSDTMEFAQDQPENPEQDHPEDTKNETPDVGETRNPENADAGETRNRETPKSAKPGPYNKEIVFTEERGGTGAPPEKLGKRQQHKTPEHMRIARLFGLEARDMTLLVDAVLDATGKRALADVDSIYGERELSYAQECAAHLVQIGVHSPELVDSALHAFHEEFPRFGAPSYRQLIEAAGKATQAKRSFVFGEPKRGPREVVAAWMD